MLKFSVGAGQCTRSINVPTKTETYKEVWVCERESERLNWEVVPVRGVWVLR